MCHANFGGTVGGRFDVGKSLTRWRLGVTCHHENWRIKIRSISNVGLSEHSYENLSWSFVILLFDYFIYLLVYDFVSFHTVKNSLMFFCFSIAGYTLDCTSFVYRLPAFIATLKTKIVPSKPNLSFSSYLIVWFDLYMSLNSYELKHCTQLARPKKRNYCWVCGYVLFRSHRDTVPNSIQFYLNKATFCKTRIGLFSHRFCKQQK